ncbi:MAG: AsmA-like C-terminal region-containing protein [Acidobacteriota bacterium]
MKLRGIVAAVVLVLIAFVGVVVWRLPITSDRLRAKVIETLSDRLDSDVELSSLAVRAFPRLHAEGGGLTIKRRGQGGRPPLISVKSFTVDGDLLGLYRKHVGRVELVGLDIQIPPKNDEASQDKTDGEQTAGPGRPGPTAEKDSQPGSGRSSKGGIVVDSMVTTDARLVIIPRESDKSPKVWNIHKLHMTSVGAETAMPFEATLTNAIPPGEIETSGRFGPWEREEPGATPLDGIFSFAKADLSVFKGISGILSAHGTFGGKLERIDIHGETSTPDFTVAVGGHPVPLNTKYHSQVDGTNGNTILERIDASFLNTAIVAKGAVIDLPGDPGRQVSMNVTIDRGRLEDLLKLAVKTPTPPMQGALKLSTRFILPPGDKDVVEKLQLKGQFSIAGGRFTSDEVQQKINDLSRRGRGKPAAAPQQVASDFKGDFSLANGVLGLPKVSFSVPGAGVNLTGQYALRRETLGFKGELTMDATVSEAAGGGLKGRLLKVMDPIFQKNGRTVIPIKITGTRQAPAFGLDAGALFKK